MLKKEDIKIERPYEYVYRVSIPRLGLTAYGFTEKKAMSLLEKNYNQYLENFLKMREDSSHNSTFL